MEIFQGIATVNSIMSVSAINKTFAPAAHNEGVSKVMPFQVQTRWSSRRYKSGDLKFGRRAVMSTLESRVRGPGPRAHKAIQSCESGRPTHDPRSSCSKVVPAAAIFTPIDATGGWQTAFLHWLGSQCSSQGLPIKLRDPLALATVAAMVRRATQRPKPWTTQLGLVSDLPIPVARTLPPTPQRPT